jgi:hypothetical protein
MAGADELKLRDGERITVRPIRPADGGLLAQLHGRLSPDSVYLRYFGVKPELRPAEIQRFTVLAEEWRFAHLLLERLLDVAWLAGRTSLTAEVLTSDQPMLRLFQGLPLPSSVTGQSGYLEVRLRLGDLEVTQERARVAAAHLAQAAVIRTGLNPPGQV